MGQQIVKQTAYILRTCRADMTSHVRPDFVAHRRGILTRQMIEREWHRRSVPMLAYENDADMREDQTHDPR